ncbi:V-type ATP synthase subunit A [Entomospira entomophila]|uniref:V-type ATP synthase alpha chain n=1 Tax=Entomospira entomophila TaxID=2719988 RepID=A0A968KS41_9SPIO|nr:V-type ATP synthase subunit A [Entomospira entomophilus]NIZ39947.1 V-type ATP synthase subunit A [Entomospira entomophilus]WDI35508.1 V-type ATP synthase subunit A [Entomospira entomophilus]
MSKTKGVVIGVNGNMATIEVSGPVIMNEVGYIVLPETKTRLKSEVIRIRGNRCQMQVFESTRDVAYGNEVEFTGELLVAELGPGLLGQIYDGLQNPLPELAEEAGYFLQRGIYLAPLNVEKKWEFKASVKVGDTVTASDYIGSVPENSFDHKIMVPFNMQGSYTVKSIKESGSFTIHETIAEITDERGESYPLTLSFHWPVKRAVNNYTEKVKPVEPMITKIRIIDTFLPVSKGGTFCTPGPFGAGKTVLQQQMSRNSDVDVVIIAACGERAGEVVETLKEFPELIDPKTGRSLMERTIIICNTSSMPVAAREASVYTAVTLAEYYRQMGLDVLMLADSTSRWAQAMREMSGRLEEIPGEEAFPAYLESTIAGFYERAGAVKLKTGAIGTITIGGAVSPAGGNFEEPVTQATLKVVGNFLGLSRERSDARKYPAIHPIDSWSKYEGIISPEAVAFARRILYRGIEIEQMMKVVGEEGTSDDDYLLYLKGEFFDAVYLQQNGFDPADASVTPERQQYVFNHVIDILASGMQVTTKEESRNQFNRLRMKFLDWNGTMWQTPEFEQREKEVVSMVKEMADGSYLAGSEFLKRGN